MFSKGFDDHFLGKDIWSGPLEQLGDVAPQPGTLWMIFPVVEAIGERDFERIVEAIRKHHVPGLSFHERRLPRKAIALLKDLPSLRLLDLELTAVGDADLDGLAGLPSLEHLFLWNRSKKITDAGLRTVANLPELRTLEVTEGNIASIAGMAPPKLERLALRGLISPKGRGLEQLKALPTLRELNLGGWRLRDSDIGFLSDLPKLTGLDLSAAGEARLSSKGLSILTQLPHLERLMLAPQPVTDSVIAALDGAVGLRFLKIIAEADTEGTLTDGGLRRLAEHRALEHVALECGAPVTTAGIKELGKLRELRYLGLHGMTITDAVLDAFGGLSKLEVFDFSRTKITVDAVKRVLGGEPTDTNRLDRRPHS